jgi:hypothetical protein
MATVWSWTDRKRCAWRGDSKRPMIFLVAGWAGATPRPGCSIVYASGVRSPGKVLGKLRSLSVTRTRGGPHLLISFFRKGSAASAFLRLCAKISSTSRLASTARQSQWFWPPDVDNDLVELSFVGRCRSVAPDFCGDLSPEPLAPDPDAFLRNDHAALRQQILNIAQAQRKSMRRPDGIRNDGAREAYALQTVW